jgi:hypothetical protein
VLPPPLLRYRADPLLLSCLLALRRVGVYPVVSAEHVAKGASAKAWVDSVIAKAGRGKGECRVLW